jgi:four helix bundle protein
MIFEEKRVMRKDQELSLRLFDFTVQIIGLVQAFPKNPVGLHVGNQLLRAGTSPGANYEEACGAESHRDFCHKVGIVLKELKESRYWLRVAQKALLNQPVPQLDDLLEETEQLIAIFGKSLSTARSKK